MARLIANAAGGFVTILEASGTADQSEFGSALLVCEAPALPGRAPDEGNSNGKARTAGANLPASRVLFADGLQGVASDR